jgi:serine/threonine-protein kinase
MVGRALSHYRIVEKLGAGGMGEVYLAEDTRLNRKVALKLLPAHLTKEEDRLRRFAQEAKAASALNHPNIVTIYEIGQHDDAHFIATEFIEGETLRQHVARQPMTLHDILDVTIQVAGALNAAHVAGIVHRDIKPENIMLRPDGLVKVLDFGLAKPVERQPLAPHPEAPTLAMVDTNPGTVMGTAHYMSPEQARGQPVDARSDIFSLGVVVYEMIAGRSPFAGETPSDAIAAILRVEPPPLAQYWPDIPADLERIIQKALRKDKEDRYQTAKDLLLDLKSLKQEMEAQEKLERLVSSSMSAGGAVSKKSQDTVADTVIESAVYTAGVKPARPTSSAEYLVSGIKRHKGSVAFALAVIVVVLVAFSYFGGREEAIDSLAVLPLVNVAANPSTEYLSDGLTERLINSLSQLPNLKVMSSNSVFRYKGKEIDVRVVGRELGVRAVLTGRIVPRGDDLFISIELVDAQDNSRIWGEQFTRKFADILLVQEEISRDVSEKLRLKLTGEDKKRLEAYQLYLKGRYYWNKRTTEALKKAIEHFEQAVQKEPNYAPAYAGLADCYNMLVIYSALSPKEGFSKAKTAAMRALEIDDTLAEAHTSLAFVKFRLDWDWLEAEREFSRAIDLNPNYAPAHQWYSNFLVAMGRRDEAIAEARRTQQLDPFSLIGNSQVAWILYFARRYDEAIDQCHKTLQLDPSFFAAQRYLGLVFEQKKMYDAAVAHFERAVTLSGGPALMRAHLGHAYALAGRRDQARKILDELIEHSQRQYVSSYLIALIHAALGEKDRAFEWLEKAYEERAEFLVYLKVDPRLDRLRSDPRLASLLRRVGLAS